MPEPRADDLKTLDFALYRIVQQEEKLKGLEQDIDGLRKEAAERETIRLQREQRWMWWGLLFLGSTITVLGKLIWNNLLILLPRKIAVAWLRAIVAAATVTMLCMMLWMVCGTSLVLRPVSWTFDRSNNLITIKRVVLWPGDVWVRYSHTVRVPSTGRLCATSGVLQYEHDVDFAVVAVTGKLAPCLHADDFIVTNSWSVLVFGALPLRPDTLVQTSEEVLKPSMVSPYIVQ